MPLVGAVVRTNQPASTKALKWVHTWRELMPSSIATFSSLTVTPPPVVPVES